MMQFTFIIYSNIKYIMSGSLISVKFHSEYNQEVLTVRGFFIMANGEIYEVAFQSKHKEMSIFAPVVETLKGREILGEYYFSCVVSILFSLMIRSSR